MRVPDRITLQKKGTGGLPMDSSLNRRKLKSKYVKLSSEDINEHSAGMGRRGGSLTSFKPFTPLHDAISRLDLPELCKIFTGRVDVSCRDSNGRTPLHIAAAKGEGYDYVVSLLLEKGADISSQDNDGRTALHITLDRKNPSNSTVLLLLENGADISSQDKYGRTPLHIAAVKSESHSYAVSLLLEKGAEISSRDNGGRTALHIAVDQYNPSNSTISLLLEKGVDVSSQDKYGRTPLHIAATSRDPPIVSLLLKKGADISSQDKDGLTPLHIATARSNIPIASLLLEKGADISLQDKCGRTPLHIAAAKGEGYDYVVSLLLEKRADISSRDNDGRTALHIAVDQYSPSNSTILLLLEKGADISSQDKYGRTPLHIATTRSNLLVASLLLEKGADISSQDNYGRTALHIAATRNNLSTTSLLVEQGAKISCKDKNGQTPLHFAAAVRGQGMMVEELMQLGGDVSCQDNSGRTPLDLAKSSHCTKAISLLRKAMNESHSFRVTINSTLGGLSPQKPSPSVNTPVRKGVRGDNEGNGFIENDVISSDTISGDFTPEILPSPLENTIRGLEGEGEDGDGDDDEDGNEDEYEDEDDGVNELEYSDDEMETGSNSGHTYFSVGSSNLTDNGSAQSCGDGGGGGGESKEGGISRKRSAHQSLENQSKGSSQDDDDEPFDQPSKRQKKDTEGKGKSPDQLKKPFACPYFKKNPAKYAGCSKWCNTKIHQVKEHCKTEHLKPLWCGRCKVFQAGIYSEIERHSAEDDCKRTEVFDSSKDTVKNKTKQKAADLDKAKTWQRIYEILFPLYIPNQFWQSIEIPPGDYDELPSAFITCSAASCSKKVYQIGLAGFLKDRLELIEGAADKLLNEYDEEWRSTQMLPGETKGPRVQPYSHTATFSESPTKRFGACWPNSALGPGDSPTTSQGPPFLDSAGGGDSRDKYYAYDGFNYPQTQPQGAYQSSGASGPNHDPTNSQRPPLPDNVDCGDPRGQNYTHSITASHLSTQLEEVPQFINTPIPLQGSVSPQNSFWGFLPDQGSQQDQPGQEPSASDLDPNYVLIPSNMDSDGDCLGRFEDPEDI